MLLKRVFSETVFRFRILTERRFRLSSVHEPDTSPRRADARRNRERVLEAARAAFAEEGLDAQVPAIARLAGVGVGTVYRHFPTKEALVEALAQAHFAHLIELAEEALAAPGDPWESLRALLWRSARLLAEDRGLAEIAANRPEAIGAASARAQERLEGLAGQLMARAQEAGVMRPDATPADISLVMCGLGKIAALQRSGKPVSWERYLTIVLDGLRTQG